MCTMYNGPFVHQLINSYTGYVPRREKVFCYGILKTAANYVLQGEYNQSSFSNTLARLFCNIFRYIEVCVNISTRKITL